MDGFAGSMGVRAERAADGHSQLDFTAGQEHLNPAGSLHGGVLATLVDAAMGLAARSAAEDGEVPATSQLTVAYLNPGGVGEVQVSAKVRKQGAHLLLCEAEAEQDGRTLVHALATFAVLPRS